MHCKLFHKSYRNDRAATGNFGLSLAKIGERRTATFRVFGKGLGIKSRIFWRFESPRMPAVIKRVKVKADCED